MSILKKLAGQTAIYGLSSILGRFLNFFLTPIHTTALSKFDYGVNSDIYSLIAFLMVIFTFGMETTFFRFFSKKENAQQGNQIFSHTLFPVLSISLVFILLMLLFLPQVAGIMKYEEHPEYPIYMVLIVMMDAIAAVPFAKLRAQNKALKFVSIRISQILIFVLLNVFIFSICPWLISKDILTSFIQQIYHPEWGVAYIFIANIIANGVMLLLLLPTFKGFSFRLNWSLEKKYLLYATPLVIAGFAGIANEMLDRQFLKYLLPEGRAFEEIAMYGANYKIATFMMMFIQAFRFAAEPFFFAQAKEENPKKMYAQILKFFTLFQSVIFVGLVCFIDVVKIFIDPKYWEGLYLAPLLLFANLLVGINMNLNIWYKLEDKTRYGAYITFTGFAVTVGLNLLLIPKYEILGAAIATLLSYASMTAYAYYLNQKHYHTPYPIARIFTYLLSGIALAYLSFAHLRENFLASSAIVLTYLLLLYLLEKKDIQKLLKHDK